MPANHLPTGTVTLLFTDIEGSTRLWEDEPAMMGATLEQHDALIREAIERAGGTVFKTVGDGFCAAFEVAGDALRAAVEAQLAIQDKIPVKVRMALHTGAVAERDGDLFGQPLNRVARLLAIGHGGQVLLSLACAELVRDSMPPRSSIRELGEHRLKDLGRPETVFQLDHESLPTMFPALRSLSGGVRHNLPLQLTTFVGRAQQLEESARYLGANRLVTLTGTGGSGKTRLALQVAADALESFPNGVWFCELAPLADPGLLAQSVSAVLGVKDEPGVLPLDNLLKFLKDQKTLLVLDNCEHLLDASAQLVSTLLGKAPYVKVLATSREALGVAGELAYRIPSLTSPDPRGDLSPESLSGFESVMLFLDRAEFHRPGFGVTRANGPALASICHRLDGIPLAIELAAARLRSLGVEDIESRLDQRFRLLTGGSRTALPRQQTLRSLIDWSYDLLNVDEKVFLTRLSVFAGGWTLDTAEQIFADDNVLDLLDSLFEKSLVSIDHTVQPSRFRLLETVRQYARDRLLESGEGEQWRDAHARYFIGLAEEAEMGIRSHEQLAWLSRYEAEQDNFRLALEWLLQGDNAELAMRLSAAVSRFWAMRGRYAEGREWNERALSQPGAEVRNATRAKLLNCAAILIYDQGEIEQSAVMYEESLEIREELGDRDGMVSPAINLGNVEWSLGRYDNAAERYRQSLALSRELGNRLAEATSLNNLGSLASRQQEFAKSIEYFEESLKIRRELGEFQHVALSLSNIADALLGLGKLDRSRDMALEALEMRLEVQDVRGLLESFDTLMGLAAAFGKGETAAKLNGGSIAMRERYHCPIPPADLPMYESFLAKGAAVSGSEEEFESLTTESLGLSLEEMAELARTL